MAGAGSSAIIRNVPNGRCYGGGKKPKVFWLEIFSFVSGAMENIFKIFFWLSRKNRQISNFLQFFNWGPLGFQHYTCMGKAHPIAPSVRTWLRRLLQPRSKYKVTKTDSSQINFKILKSCETLMPSSHPQQFFQLVKILHQVSTCHALNNNVPIKAFMEREYI